jgi:hypothetical protein
MEQKNAPPIPTQTQKQPKPKNKTAPNRTVGQGNPKAAHPHKTKKSLTTNRTFF